MKKAKKALFSAGISILLVLTFLMISVPAAFAAAPKVTVSLESNKTNVRVGNTFVLTVSLDIANGGGTLIDHFSGIDVEYETSLFELKSVSAIGSDNIVISEGNPVSISYQRNYDDEDINAEIASLTFQVKTTAVLGESKFQVSGPSNFYDADKGKIAVAYNSPYTAVSISDKMSDNCNLSNLIVNEGNLTPSFKSTTTKYAVKVTNNVSRVNLVYNTEDATAKVTVSNATNLKVGANTVKVIVTAEDGTTKLYTVTVTRAEASETVESKLTSSEDSAGSISEDQYNKDLQKVKNRYLIIILVLVFAVLAELAYILIEKFGKKKPAVAASPEATSEVPGEDLTKNVADIGEPQSIIDSILDNSDELKGNKLGNNPDDNNNEFKK